MIVGDNRIRLRAVAGMRLNRLDEIARAAVMQQKEALAEPPERRRAELVAGRLALRDAVGEASSHRVDGEVAERLERHLALMREGR